MSSPARTVILLTAMLTIAPVAADGVSRIVEYRSPLDDSQQAYGVYLPDAGPPRGSGYPAVLHGHGYGWRVSSSFGGFQREWADRHGWVLIHLNARGPNFYDGVGDYETLRVIEDASAKFGLDPDRIYMTGGSMGGTGALRMGLRHPDVFAAVMGVDGWTDYRLWHKHWYARTDYPDLIEEFRRPLLQAASPLYWAERGELGAIGHIVDGADTTVWPENGLRLYEQLRDLKIEDPGAFDHSIIFNPALGHGRGTDYRAIYGFFQGRRRVETPRGFTIQTSVLRHGELYWGRIDDFRLDGMLGSLEVDAEGDLVAVQTCNISEFTLMLRAGPTADRDSVRVYADGFSAYHGPPETLTLQAETNEAGAVVGWRVTFPEADPVKHPELAGPVGDAFERPFVVAWGTAGPAEETAR
ncbi:MAG: prolyl oligopeptidase family serine peptidase, partial [Armatimonadota bacterium]